MLTQTLLELNSRPRVQRGLRVVIREGWGLRKRVLFESVQYPRIDI